MNFVLIDSISGSSSLASPAPKKRTYLVPFQDEWLQNPNYQAWLEKGEDDLYQARCKVCYKSITTRKSTLDKHNQSDMHILNMQSVKVEEGAPNFEVQVKRAEKIYIRYSRS